jgi:hypothetical protein
VDNGIHSKFTKPVYRWFQQELYQVYEKGVHALILNGDLIDGEGKKGTQDTIDTDTKHQAEMFLNVAEDLGLTNIPQIVMTYGTAFHVTSTWDAEEYIAEHLEADIPTDTVCLEVNGTTLAARHHARRGDTPYTQPTQLQKEKHRDDVHQWRMGQEPADIVIRSHVHYYVWVETADGWALSNPTLQVPGSIYGRRMMGFNYDIGFTELVFMDDGFPIAIKHIMPPLEVQGQRRYLHVNEACYTSVSD